MASDGRVMPYPLVRASCDCCGYGFRVRALSAADRDSLYDGDYGLGLRDVDADERRAASYATQIAGLVSRHSKPGADPWAVVEFGAGTAALLTALTSRLPIGEALGIEPAEQLVAAAQARAPAGVTIRRGYAETALETQNAFDLCISVNVIEHASDPADFLVACRKAVRSDGLVVVICPDGELAGVELLFADHVSSFSLVALSGFAQRAGLSLIDSYPLDEDQFGFRISLFRVAPLSASSFAPGRKRQLTTARKRYLLGWRELARAAPRVHLEQPFLVFGTGEFCDLLEAYVPGLIDRAEAFLLDEPLTGIRSGRPVLSTATFIQAKEDRAVLAAVNPRTWGIVRTRFTWLGIDVRHPFEFCSLRTELS